MNETAAGRWAEVERLFDAALALAPREREAYLQRACPEPALRDQVQKLLEAARDSGDFLERKPLPAAEPATLASGEKLGIYRIERLIGRGGMSEVYLARRDDGQYQQRVALKLLTLSLSKKADSFFNERQILAQLQHPLIGRLLDGGLAPDGRPYMVMEYVEGVNLVQHCAQVRAGLDERLRLFGQVCEAVAYAHRNLVVHRDLKPANILITPEGQVKLLDFGIAKLLDPGLPLADLRTLHLTPRYAAPEQLQGKPVTTATDVYALGVLLHELLAGEPPFQLGSMPLAVAMQRILNETPLSLSASAAAQDAPPVSARLLRGDLDAIAAKALRKEPEGRYASATEFLADLDRYRSSVPVAARGYALGYVLRRFVRRHRLAVVLSGAILGALVAGLGTSLWFYFDAMQARDRAESAADTLEAVDDFLNRDLLAGATLDSGPVRDLTVKALLERAAEQVDKRFADRPAVAARVHFSIAHSYGGLSLFVESRQHSERALALYEQHGLLDTDLALQTLAGLAGLADLQDRHADSVALYDKALRAYEQRYGRRHPELLALRPKAAFANFHAGAMRRALAELQVFFEEAPGAEGLDPAVIDQARAREGYFLYSIGRFQEAEAVLRRTLAEQQRKLGPEAGDTAISHMLLGAAQMELGQLAGADTELGTAEVTLRKLVPPGDAFLATLQSFTGRLRVEQGRTAEGVAILEETLRTREQIFGSGSSVVAWTRHLVAEGYLRQGKVDRAIAALRQALPVEEKVDGSHHPFTLKVRVTLAEALRQSGDYKGARAVLTEVTPEALGNLPEQHPFLAQLRRVEGLLALAEGQTELARTALTEALDILELRHGAQHSRTQRVRAELQALPPKL